MSRIKIKMKDIVENYIKYKKRIRKQSTIGMNYEATSSSEVQKSKEVLKQALETTNSQKKLIFEHFANHDRAKKIFKKFYDDDFGLHEAIVASRSRNSLNMQIAIPKIISGERLFEWLRANTTPRGKNICLNYPYELHPVCSRNYLPEMRNRLQKKFDIILENILIRREVYCTEIINKIQINLSIEGEDEIFILLDKYLENDLVHTFTSEYREYIVSKGFRLTPVDPSFKMTEKEYDHLRKFLNYEGPLIRDLIFWKWYSENDEESKTQDHPFPLKAELEKQMENDIVFAYIRL